MRSFRIFQQTLLRFNTSRCRFGTAPQQRYSPVLQRIIGRQTSPFSIASRVQSLRSRPSAIRKVLNRRFNSTNSPSPNPTPTLGSPSPEPPSLSLTQRLRKLSREYGWSALGVYFLLTALDFPFCFLAVRWLGTERIGQWEHTVVEWIKRASPIQIPPAWRRKEELEQEKEAGQMVLEAGKGELVVPYDHGVEEAERLNRSEKASIWTQLALAYAIHKSFIFIRVPLTAALTPKVVKVLRGWGWDIGKRTKSAAKTASEAAKKT